MSKFLPYDVRLLGLLLAVKSQIKWSSTIFWIYSGNMRSGNQIKSEVHRKKDRQRNLLPAKTGILILIFFLLLNIIYYVLYGMTLQNVDVYTRSYYLGFVNDLFPCFISPIIVVFEAPAIRRKLRNVRKNSTPN